MTSPQMMNRDNTCYDDWFDALKNAAVTHGVSWLIKEQDRHSHTVNYQKGLTPHETLMDEVAYADADHDPTPNKT